MGKLIRLELYNFKSYKGHHVLLFGDAYFTSIIGPNGSGKSNAMDAISFVLGIKSSHLRSTHLRDLVYRGRVLRKSTVNGEGANGGSGPSNGDAHGELDGTQDEGRERNDPKSAWVMAVYEDDAGEEQHWKRTITNQGASEYRINERIVTAQDYNQSLESENILIKARNFLVFQGDVEAIASQSPKDLTRLIEQISGSLESKAEYERLKAESEAAAEQQTFQLNRRRGMNSEIKQYQEQKREAENYAKKADERDQALVTHVLWKLYHFQRQIEASKAEIQKHQNELKEFQRGVAKFEQNLEAAKKEHGRVARDVGKAEKAIKQKEKEIEDRANSLVPVDEKIEISTNKLAKYSTRIAEITKERDGQAANVRTLEKDLTVVEKAEAQWQAEWVRNASKQGGQLSEADLQQYNKLKEEVNKRSSADQIRVDNVKRQRAADEGTVHSLKSKVESSEWQLKSAEADLNSITDRKNATDDLVQQTLTEIEAKRKELNALTSERLRVAQMRTELDEKLQEVLRKLLDADDGRKESERELKTRDMVSSLKRIFPGVKGRVGDLCRPKQKKYADAVSTVLGRNFDAVVVDTEKTATACIQHLKDQRSGTGIFLPLDTLQVKAVNSNLKGMHRGMRPSIETVDYDHSVARAISYACGNSIICDDLSIAKYLCYERQVDAKAVTLEGTVISKGGLMTGGRGKEQNARRWDDAEVEKFHKLKDKLRADMEALPKPRSRSAEEETLQDELSRHEHRYKYAQEELGGLNRNLASKKKEVDHAKSQLDEAQPKYRAERHKLDDLDAKIQEFQKAVSGVEDEVFATFCQRLGFDDIRDYEARQGTMQQEAAQKKLEFTTQKSRIENQLSFERQRLEATEVRIKALRSQEQRDRALIDELKAEREETQVQLDALHAELDQLGEALDDHKIRYQKSGDRLAEQRKEVQKRTKNVEASIKAKSALESEIQRSASDRYTLLRRCKLDDIAIPLTAGSAPLDRLPIDDLVQSVNQDAMDMEEDDPASSAHKAPTAEDYGIEPDFGVLDDDLKEEEEEGEAVETDLQEKIRSLNAELDKMAPNMRAMDRLDMVETKLRATEKEFEDARKHYRATKDAFEAVMQKRSDLFNKAFSHISDQIGPIYRDLTRTTNYPLGGQAYLDIEDSDEPYLDGIKYHAMPPLKRFRDMEHLSGGEKTMAALALLFAVHSYQPSPFFVLDEVDAALDNANVSKIAGYIREHAGPGMQFIVISLKTGLFQNSEALVGIYRDQGANTSKALTLDLRKYQ